MSTKAIANIAGVILAVWLTIGLIPVLFFSDPAARGSFGDMFGAVNALFSGLALAGVVCAILLQREELRLQRQELELTRSELRRTAEAQASSASTLEQQYKLAEKNTKLQALTALLQSCNDRINAERVRRASLDRSILRHDSTPIPRLEKQLEDLEQQVRQLIDQG